MKIFPLKSGKGYITAYRATIGCREAREAGLLREDGSSRELRKAVDAKAQSITIMIDWEAEGREKPNV